jgi:dolichol-phosphate mannosyltransferase
MYTIRTDPATLDLSVVVPVYNEEPNIDALALEISSAMEPEKWTWECLWVDDRSTDGTFEALVRLHERDRRHQYLRLATHEGQSAALAVGFSNSRGRYIATLDGDGQSDPADVPRLVSRLENDGLHVVNGRREKRMDNFVRKASSRIANAFRNRLTGESVPDVGCSLRAFRRECVDGVFVYRGMHRFLPTLIKLNGYDKSAEMAVRHRPRRLGQTKYSVGNRLWVGIADTFGVVWMKRRGAAPRVQTSSLALGESGSAADPTTTGSVELKRGANK